MGRRPPVWSRAGLLLTKAATDRQAAFVGDQSGGRVFLFLERTISRTITLSIANEAFAFLESHDTSLTAQCLFSKTCTETDGILSNAWRLRVRSANLD
jgi:hypothetical protein